MNSLRLKLLAGFVLVAVVGLLALALAAYRGTDAAFAHYVRQGQSQRLAAMQQTLADYYATRQSWAGVQNVLESTSGGMGRMGMGMGRGMSSGMMGQQQAILADAQGVVVASVPATRSITRLSAREMEAAVPITVGGRTVGLLLAQGAGLPAFSELEEAFLTSVNRSLLAAGLLAGGLAVVISLVLARRLTAPIVSMTQAAQAMARGDLGQRVTVTSKDEIGRLAEAFNAMAAGLATAEELRRNLVADVAHELRTPLAVLRADLEALQDGVYEPTPQRIATLQEEVELLSRLVTDLQELSLAEAGQLALERRPTDLVQVCRQAVEAMAPQAQQRGVTMAMGQAPAAVTSHVDGDRIGQVLRNLLSNALRYTPAGGSVTVDCRTDGDAAVIAVRDTGTGIKPEDLPHVFDRFYRGEKSRSRRSGGAGLGLAIVKQLVEAHGGRVWVESTVGAGSTFYITLPLGSHSTTR